MSDKHLAHLDYQPQEWGPGAWKFLHTITFSYPESPDQKTQERTYRFFDALQHVLPCSKCRGHYSNQFRRITSSTFRNRESLTRWLVDLHNVVNESHGKKPLAYDDIRAMYGGEELLCGSAGSGSGSGSGNHAQKKPRERRSPYFGFIVTIVVLVLILVLMCVLVGLQCRSHNPSTFVRRLGRGRR